MSIIEAIFLFFGKLLKRVKTLTFFLLELHHCSCETAFDFIHLYVLKEMKRKDKEKKVEEKERREKRRKERGKDKKRRAKRCFLIYICIYVCRSTLKKRY